VQFARPPGVVDRVFVHQFDPARPSPGGIDTCLRGISRYLPDGQRVAVIGVDTGAGPEGRELGKWELHKLGENAFWFLPVARLDPADQKRRIPHSVRLAGGLMKYRKRVPRHELLQVHRMDTAAILRWMLPGEQVYFVHTQENGLVGATSDSFWRHFGGIHQRLERSVVRNAKTVVVFNEDYAKTVKAWNSNTRFSPTWYDPALVVADGGHEKPYEIVWVGRLEVPKDPALAIAAFAEVVALDSSTPWTLSLLGSGTLFADVEAQVSKLPAAIANRVALRGRVSPDEVARNMASAGLFLMTSHAGYEGYARVLVEAMASGLPAVVTEGSDTGHLVVDAITGYTCTRSPAELATCIIEAQAISRRAVVAAVQDLDGPSLVARIFSMSAEDSLEGAVKI
jgi:glycosyltransferase involved in cell wall biosynthesis